MPRKDLSLSEKISILDKIKNKPNSSHRQLSEVIKVPKSTISRLLQQQDKLREEWKLRLGFKKTSQRRKREGKYPNVEDALIQWFSVASKGGVRISGPTLKCKSEELAKKLGLVNFKATDGWLSRWKCRHGISYKKSHGEKDSAEQSESEKPPELLKRFSGDNIYNADETDAQQPSSSGKEAGLISYTNPGPSTSQENLLVESEDLIFVKEEPYVSDNEQEHYETAFVDFSATESYRHDELSGSSYGGAPIPETYYGVETESNVEPSDAQQSGHVIEKAVSLAAGQAHDSKRSSTQRSTQQDNARSCDEKEQDKTSSPTEASGNYTKSRFRVMELTLEQLKKEHKAKMKEHEANMREHEKRMSDQEKITEMQLDIMKKEHEMKITEIEFRYQDLKKKSDWDSKVHKLTIMNLQQKLSTCQLEHQEKSKLHELVVQELQQKLTNSQLEHRILLKKLKELGE